MNWALIFIYFAAIFGIYTMFCFVACRITRTKKPAIFEPAVLLVVKNGQQFIEGVVKAVVRHGIEYNSPCIVVVDDGSNDETPEILRLLAKQHPGIRLVSTGPTSDRSPVEAGLKVCEGEIIMVLEPGRRLSAKKAEEAAARFFREFGQWSGCNTTDHRSTLNSHSRTVPDVK